MKFYDAIYDIAKQKDLRIEEICTSIGKSKAYIFAANSRGSSPQVNTASKIAGACDYVVCLVPKGKVPKSGIVIDS